MRARYPLFRWNLVSPKFQHFTFWFPYLLYCLIIFFVWSSVLQTIPPLVNWLLIVVAFNPVGVFGLGHACPIFFLKIIKFALHFFSSYNIHFIKTSTNLKIIDYTIIVWICLSMLIWLIFRVGWPSSPISTLKVSFCCKNWWWLDWFLISEVPSRIP